MTNELIMDFSDYAKSVGKSRQYIHKLYRQGRLEKAIVRNNETKRTFINKEIADSVLLGIKPIVKNKETIVIDSPEDSDILNASFDEAKRYKICFEAISEKNKVHKDNGALISREEVCKQASSTALIFRDKMLTIPNQVAPLLVGKTSLFDIKNILSEYISSVLKELSNANNFDKYQKAIE